MKPKTLAIWMTVLALAGLVIAGLLTWDHQSFMLGEAGGAGICEQGSGCEQARRSRLSIIPLGPRPPLPISLPGLAFYFGVLVLLTRRLLGHESDVARRDTNRLLLATSILASAYSLFLMIASIRGGYLCAYCAGLYAVNFGLLVAAWMAKEESLGEAFGGVWGSLVRPSAWLLAAAFAASIFGAYTLYASPLRDAVRVKAARLVNATPVDKALTPRISFGPEDAPIHIVEFADLQCGHCRVLYQTLHKLQAKQPDKIRVSMMHYPLDSTCNPNMETPFHPQACALARATECLNAQGKMSDPALAWLFETGSRQPPAKVRAKMVDFGADPNTFDACMEDPATLEAVKADIELGASLGVKATPTFFVNGRIVEGGRTQPFLELVIEALLERGEG